MHQLSENYKKALILCAFALLAYLLKFGFNAFIAHHLSRAAYGDFSVGLQTFMLASALLLLGTGTAAKRFLSTFIKKHADAGVKNYVSWNLRLIWVASFFFLLLLFIFLAILLLVHLFDIKRIETYHIAIYLLFFSPVGASIVLITSYLQCNSNIYWANFLQNAARFVFLIPLLFVTIYFFNAALSTATLILIIIATFGLLLIVELAVLFLKAPTIAKHLMASYHHRPAEVDSAWKKTSLRLITSQIIFSILTVLDLYIVEIFSRNEHSVGEYAALLVVTGVSSSISGAICSFLAPLIAPNIDTNKPYLQKAINSAALINASANLLVIVLIGVFLKYVLSLFGAAYYNDTTVAVYLILSIGYYLRCLCTPAQQLLMYSGHEDLVMKVNMAELVMIVAAGIVLTMYYGIVGIAFTATVAMSCRAIVYIICANRKLGYRTIGIF